MIARLRALADRLLPERRRAYLYRVVTALSVVLVASGELSQAEADLWLQVAASVLAIGVPALAAIHTSTKHPKGE